MSLNGINNSLLASLGSVSRPGELQRPATDRSATPGAGRVDPSRDAADAARAALKPQPPIAGQSVQGAAQGAVPAEAPPGTDPTLWSVLTSEERNFFAKTAALGPLTYGRIKAATHPAPPAARGVRLDVRA